MAERGTSSRRRAGSTGPRARNGSRSTASSARSSAAFDRDATPTGNDPSSSSSSSFLLPARLNPSLRSVGSRVSLTEQFATTRREYEFGFDDAVSFVAPSDYEGGGADGDADDAEEGDDTLTAAGSFDGVVVVPPVPEGDEAVGAAEQTRPNRAVARARVHRSHYELLCLPEGGAASEGDVRRAYFRLYDILRSRKLPAQYRELAENYFSDVQVAFETLIGKDSKEKYDLAVMDEDEALSSEGEDDGTGEDAKGGAVKQTSTQFVRRLRQQQEQDSTEVGVQLDVQFISRNKSHIRRRLDLPSFSLTQTSTTSFPSISHFLEPRARRVRNALNDPAILGPTDEDEDLELYCPPPTVTVSSSVFAANMRSAYLPSAGTLSQYQNLIPDTLPKDRPLEWYSTYFAPLISLKLRQEIFFQEPGLSEVALRRHLPDAVVEIETDALNAASVTARASHTLGLDGADGGGMDDEPVHVEASVSVNRSWLARNYATRLGLAVHKRLSPDGVTVFACADSGTSSLWESLSLASFWDGQRAEQDGTGASWRSYMDQLSRLLGQGLMPYYYSPPTVEIGYKFSSLPDTMGMTSGRPFTKQARSGLRRLNDEASLADVGKGGSWTVSGAVTAAGVAGYLRYGRDLFTSHSPSKPSSARWRDLLGFHMEAEITTQKMKNDAVFSRLRPWGRSEIAHLAVRGLKKIGKASKLGLELGVSSASNSVVLSLYFSQRNKPRFVLPVVLLRDSPPVPQHSSPRYTNVLFWSAFLPALGLAAVDHVLASRAAADAKADATTRGAARRRGKALQQRISRRRAEADALVTLLAEPVLHRQRGQRERGGLVIFSAKYGVLLDPASASSPDPKWTAPEEVADVTVGVAALVDDEGMLRIPEGLRKSKVLGFWDPKPGRTKWLVVRYVFGRKEGMRAVSGREELRLP